MIFNIQNNMTKVIKITRYSLIILSGILLVIAVGSSVAAILTPAWQTVYLAEFQSEHEHGLWIDCTITKKFIKGITHNTHCTYKFENGYMQESGIHPEEEQHKFHEWHKVVLVLFGTAILSALTALCFSFCALCIRISAIVTNVTALIAAMSSSFAMAVFFISSHRNDIRFVPGITYTYEQTKGYSYYLGLGSMIAYIFAFIISVLATVMAFLHERQQNDTSNKSYPKSRLNGESPIPTGPTSIAV
uniref:Clc-like protein n=1 Tax=Panagrolaimus sp. JU765 TaxID=591449 RepID=A0AC34Q560_9BILA